jgi:hypothetical protein
VAHTESITTEPSLELPKSARVGDERERHAFGADLPVAVREFFVKRAEGVSREDANDEVGLFRC